MDKRIKTLIGAIALALIVAIASTSYAFFTIANKEGEENVIKSGTMGLHLEDGPEVKLENAIPGSSVTKTFYVENTGNVDTAYDLYLSEVVNTFVDKTDLVYTLTSNDGGYSTIGQVQAPSVSAKIVDSEPIGVGDIHHYTLVLTFLEKNENQDDNQGVEFKGKIQINEYKDANGGGGANPRPSLPPEVRIIDGDIDTPGSEVCIDTECFYVIERDGNKLKLFAKYNLNVGSNLVPGTEGLQNVNAIGYNSVTVNGQTINNPGAVKFSDTNYWPSSSEYTYVYTNEKENGNYKANIASYVDSYVDYLNTKGVTVSGRLINQAEVESLGCSFDSWSCPSSTAPEWIKDRFYWWGFGSNSSIIIVSPLNSNIMGIPYNQPIGGVRPVITLDLIENTNVNQVAINPIVVPTDDIEDFCDILTEDCDLDTPGTKVRIGSQAFYVIGKENGKTKLFARYNLNVGENKYKVDDVVVNEGIQDNHTLGYNGLCGVVPFSDSNFWYSDGLKPEYGDSYPAYVYTNEKVNGEYKVSLAKYIDDYVDYLNSLGVNVEGRVPSAEELFQFDCSLKDVCHGYGQMFVTLFWTGSAYDDTDLWNYDTYSAGHHIYSHGLGARALILI